MPPLIKHLLSGSAIVRILKSSISYLCISALKSDSGLLSQLTHVRFSHVATTPRTELHCAGQKLCKIRAHKNLTGDAVQNSKGSSLAACQYIIDVQTKADLNFSTSFNFLVLDNGQK